MQQNNRQTPANAPTAKKPYTTPQLLDYGSIAKLTQTGNGTGADGGLIAGMRMVCL
jgi:hypothetical protein